MALAVERLVARLARLPGVEADFSLQQAAVRGEWALNEKGSIARAGLAAVEPILVASGADRPALARAVAQLRATLGLEAAD